MKKKETDDTHAGTCCLCGKKSLELVYKRILSDNRIMVVSLCKDCAKKAL